MRAHLIGDFVFSSFLSVDPSVVYDGFYFFKLVDAYDTLVVGGAERMERMFALKEFKRLDIEFVDEKTSASIAFPLLILFVETALTIC